MLTFPLLLYIRVCYRTHTQQPLTWRLSYHCVRIACDFSTRLTRARMCEQCMKNVNRIQLSCCCWYVKYTHRFLEYVPNITVPHSSHNNTVLLALFRGTRRLRVFWLDLFTKIYASIPTMNHMHSVLYCHIVIIHTVNFVVWVSIACFAKFNYYNQWMNAWFANCRWISKISVRVITMWFIAHL